jgi:antitoxin VapB
MDTAKIFRTGRSQAVRLPKEYRFEGDEVYIRRVGNTVVLQPKDKTWDDVLHALALFEPGTFPDRAQPRAQQRRPALEAWIKGKK